MWDAPPFRFGGRRWEGSNDGELRGTTSWHDPPVREPANMYQILSHTNGTQH
jgi:hypothetical protein